MKSLRLLLAALAVVTAVLADHHAHDDVDKLVEGINRITYQIFEFEHKLDARLDPARIRRAGSLEARVEALEEPSCAEHQHQCGGDDPQCISSLFVCDGRVDCRNGEDEKHCSLPTNPGDTFVGDVVFDHCTKRRPQHITLQVESVSTAKFFPAFPKVHVHLEISSDNDFEHAEASLPGDGYYSFADDELVIYPPEEDGLAFHGDFDGHNFDRFVGDIIHTASDEACARFIFHRK